MRNLLLVLAARGGAELERIQTDRRLKESESLYRAVVQDQTELILSQHHRRHPHLRQRRLLPLFRQTPRRGCGTLFHAARCRGRP